LILAGAFGWTPREINELTMSEIVEWSDGAAFLKLSAAAALEPK
jgi:hypothetical protein